MRDPESPVQLPARTVCESPSQPSAEVCSETSGDPIAISPIQLVAFPSVDRAIASRFPPHVGSAARVVGKRYRKLGGSHGGKCLPCNAHQRFFAVFASDLFLDGYRTRVEWFDSNEVPLGVFSPNPLD